MKQRGASASGALHAQLPRRVFLGSGAVAMAYLVAGRWRVLRPAEARSAGASLRVLTKEEAVSLEAFGETVVPGSATAGLVHYCDGQLALSASETLLILRYFDWPQSFLEFYRKGLRALDAVAQRAGGGPFAALDPDLRSVVARAVARDTVQGWERGAPLASFFHFVVRADAIDVTYGTPEGFTRLLDIGYFPHIAPERPW